MNDEGLDELYDLVHQVRRMNPHDARTVAGRAWANASWEVMKAARAAYDAKREAKV